MRRRLTVYATTSNFELLGRSMKRRTHLKAMLGALTGLRLAEAQPARRAKPAPSINYRFELVFENEELRQKWVATPEHQRVWPTIEKTLKSTKNYPVLLFDEV